METILQKLETTSEQTECEEQIQSESSNQEAATTSERTADQSPPSREAETKYLATLTKR